MSSERVLKYWSFCFFCFFWFFRGLGIWGDSRRVLKYCFFLFFFVFSRSWHLGVTQERVLKYFFCFLQVFCFLRACPRTSRILFSLFLCWFSAGFLKIVISLCFLSCPWLSPKITNLFFICFTPGSGVWQEKTTSTFPLPFY